MIDQIFADIMKEARERPGKNLVENIYAVLLEVGERVFAAVLHMRAEEREDKFDER